MQINQNDENNMMKIS